MKTGEAEGVKVVKGSGGRAEEFRESASVGFPKCKVKEAGLEWPGGYKLRWINTDNIDRFCAFRGL